MKKLVWLALLVLPVLGITSSDARNTVHRLSIEDALAYGESEGALQSSIKVYFGDQAHPTVERNFGTFTANRKTNAFNKSDEEACQWVFLTAIRALQDRAIRQGGDAVINIYSYYYKNKVVSASEFECGAGSFVAGVTMIGEVVKLAE